MSPKHLGLSSHLASSKVMDCRRLIVKIVSNHGFWHKETGDKERKHVRYLSLHYAELLWLRHSCED